MSFEIKLGTVFFSTVAVHAAKSSYDELVYSYHFLIYLYCNVENWIEAISELKKCQV